MRVLVTIEVGQINEKFRTYLVWFKSTLSASSLIEVSHIDEKVEMYQNYSRYIWALKKYYGQDNPGQKHVGSLNTDIFGLK